MYKIIEQFLQDDKRNGLARYSGALAGITGIFLAVDVSDKPKQAQIAMAYVQLFWLVALTIILTSLFVSFIKFIWDKEKKLEKVHDVPMVGSFSMFAFVILIGVILNLWRYVLSLYTEQIASFIVSIGVPAFFVITATLVSIFLNKRSERIWLIVFFIVDSVIVGLLSAIGGVYIFSAFTKFIYFEWFTVVAPSVSAVFFAFLSILSFYRKRSLFKPRILSNK